MGLTPIPIPAEGYRTNMNDWERVPGRVPRAQFNVPWCFVVLVFYRVDLEVV